jgi:hypothetical protein
MFFNNSVLFATALIMSIQRDIEQRAQNAILANIVENYKKNRQDWKNNPDIRQELLSKALFKPLNATFIGGAIVSSGFLALVMPLLIASLTPIFLGLAALIPVGGLLAEAFYLYSAITDEEAHAEAVAKMLRPEVSFDPKTIKNSELRGKVDQALEYWSLIDDSIESAPPGPMRERLETTTREVTHWLQAVFNLAARVDEFYDNKVIKRDLKTVPRLLKDYERKLAEEDSPEVRRQLEKTIEDGERQLRILQSLENSIEKASYQLDSTISSLGTIYSQLLLVSSKDEEGSKVHRLQAEVSEQVHRLEDLTEAMDEVYQSSF